MLDLEQFDSILLSMAQEHEGGVPQLLDTIFCFLARKTGFHVDDEKGAAEKMVMAAFRKHENKALEEKFKKKQLTEEQEKKHEEKLNLLRDIEEPKIKENSNSATEIIDKETEKLQSEIEKKKHEKRYVFDGNDDENDTPKPAEKSTEVEENNNGKLIQNNGHDCVLQNYKWTQMLEDSEKKESGSSLLQKLNESVSDSRCSVQNIVHCGFHERSMTLYCRACKKALCINCALDSHDRTHVIVNLTTSNSQENENLLKENTVRKTENYCISRIGLVPYTSPNYQQMMDILKETNYSLEVTPSIRKFGHPPPNWIGPEPDSNCEVYCERIPAKVYENHLISAFRKYGDLYGVILFMNSSTGAHTGEAVITYLEPRNAARALHHANDITAKKVFKGMRLTKAKKSAFPKSLNSEHVCIPCPPQEPQFYFCIMESLERIDKVRRKISIIRRMFSSNNMKYILDAIDSMNLEQCARHSVLIEEGLEKDNSIKNLIMASNDVVNTPTLNPAYLCHLHKIVMPTEKTAGQFKSEENIVKSVYGFCVPTTTCENLLKDIKEFFNFMEVLENSEVHEILTAALLKYQFLNIHPFADGNGRISRMFFCWFLKKSYSSYPWILFPISEKYLYFQSLYTASRGAKSDLTLYLKYICQIVLETCYQHYSDLERFINVLKN